MSATSGDSIQVSVPVLSSVQTIASPISLKDHASQEAFVPQVSWQIVPYAVTHIVEYLYVGNDTARRQDIRLFLSFCLSPSHLLF